MTHIAGDTSLATHGPDTDCFTLVVQMSCEGLEVLAPTASNHPGGTDRHHQGTRPGGPHTAVRVTS